MGALLLHWLVAVTGWARADKSLWAATRAVQGQALLLLSSLQHGRRRLCEALTRLGAVLSTCRITAQASRPYALQRALAVTRPP